MAIQVLTDKEVQDLVDRIHANRGGVDFCSLWPAAKDILTVLATIPVLSIWANLLLALGNAYASKYCKK